MMLQRYIPCNHYCIDHLICRYTDNGQDADQYEVIEYHNAPVQADTTMRYDANGNVIYDADRDISAIRYNILNLPDTIQFMNGCQIINLYDAAGCKYKSISYTVPETASSPQHEIAHYAFDIDTAWYSIKEYAGNIERLYTPIDTTMRIHNAIGYYTDSTYYHFIKDHLGNVCAVVNSIADTTIQSTLYYASGVPMAQSANRDKQPYLYNGKEFVEAHGMNTYDYGFRGYYAPIGRFTSIDPLAEQTPWQSPYSYAGNRFVNAIDWMGLGGMTGFGHSNDICQYIVIDNAGNWLGGVDDGDNTIYVDEDGMWDVSEGKGLLRAVGRMIFSFDWYMRNAERAEAKGEKYRVPGLYYGQFSMSYSCSIGLNFQQGFRYKNIDAQVGINLLSYEIVQGTFTNERDDNYKLSYFGKNNRINVTHGFGLKIKNIGFAIEQAFQVYASDLEYVPGTTTNNPSMAYGEGFTLWVNSEGFINISFSYTCGISISISIIGNIYYQGGSDYEY